MLYALIPVKDLDGAKTRVAGVLDASTRRDLVVAMYRDVLAAAQTASAVDGVAVVSSDADVLAIANSVGAEPIDEPGGLNDSLSSTSRKLAARGAKRLLILLADLPLANAEAIDRVARAAADVALVPSGDGGTNALLLAPGAIEFQYGPNSAGRHVESARGAGLSVACLDEPPLALDIDTQDDIERLRESAGVAGHTLAVLRRLGLIDPARTSA